jgi:hypothetical protein
MNGDVFDRCGPSPFDYIDQFKRRNGSLRKQAFNRAYKNWLCCAAPEVCLGRQETAQVFANEATEFAEAITEGLSPAPPYLPGTQKRIADDRETVNFGRDNSTHFVDTQREDQDEGPRKLLIPAALALAVLGLFRR